MAMRQVVSLWLPRFATDLWRRHRRAGNSPGRSGGAPAKGRPAGAGPAGADVGEAGPLALVTSVHGRLLLAAVDVLAEQGGLAPGMPLADARALLPGLRTAAHDAPGDAAALARLAEWCGRYSPWTAVDGCGCDAGGAAGLMLDVTGCAHLFGGEAALLSDLVGRLRRLGFAARAALVETPGAAWAMARFAAPAAGSADPRFTVLPPGEVRAALAPLPPAALRLPPATCELLVRFGLRTIGDLFDLPPAALAPRFGPHLAQRLAAALGGEAEALSPRRPVPPFLVRRVFAEPIAAAEDIARTLDTLLPRLCRALETAQQGARRLELAVYRVDGSVRRLGLGASRPTRDPAHLRRLFIPHLAAVDPGFGIEVMTLAVPLAEPLSALQLTLSAAGTGAGAKGSAGAVAADVIGDLPALIDRLGSRLGLDNVRTLAPRESHIPERAVTAVSALGPALVPRPAWPVPAAAGPARPLRLLPRPEPVEAVALLPDHPPARFRWRRLLHRIVRAEGPERIEPEWWVDAPAAGPAPGAARDYFRLEAEDGRRYWLYRTAGAADGGRWFLHGLFA